MALARPRGELGYIRPKRHECVVRSRPLLARAHGRASARWPWCVRALALGALGPTTGMTARPREPINPLSSSLTLTSISLFFSNSLNSKTHILTNDHSYIAFVCETRLLRIAKCREEGKLLLMRPLLRGSELLETRGEGEMRIFRLTALTIKYILSSGMGLSTDA
ncbi:hypothetical protein PIB30_074991 [Stylosanthes scabra]|uniref:Uncharacterized protein n=1 Tax=Stylosanthes scabra TaxID=79078 RepID=A0ABU6RPN8_9FABA|nr:hypothetical protein [Stylosanthes scabra]